MQTRFERALRLVTGLVIAVFVTLHFVNHSLGFFSLDAMDAMRPVVARLWRSIPGTLALYGALLIHFSLALVSLYRRTTLRMPVWEAMQLTLGLLIVPLLVEHVMATRMAHDYLGVRVDYVRVVADLWSNDTSIVKQSVLLVVVWAHLCIGMHYWLRLKHWYRTGSLYLLAIAALVPTLALLGFVRAGMTIGPVVERMGGPTVFFADRAAVDPSLSQTVAQLGEGLLGVFWTALALTLVARGARALRHRSGVTYRVHHPCGQVVSAAVGRSVLEALRAASLPHASICGGRARCTTCRVRIGRGLDDLHAPSSLEAAALKRINADANVRLACQTRPEVDVWITPLLPPDVHALSGDREDGVQGREQQIVAMFVDMRRSTALGETRLPYDVVFILNQFFAEMAAALTETGGHYAQFNGDGLLALYGLDTDAATACRQAVAGAREMHARIGALNQRLEHDLTEPLEIGIGLNFGDAIVGAMGPPDAPIISAIGDTINVAARLEALSKSYNCVAVISASTIEQAGLDFSAFPVDEADVRGRGGAVSVFVVKDPADMPDAQAVAAQVQ